MASTYSDRLKLELMETGANANTWGNNTNTNLETLDAFTAGYLSKSVAGSANVTLTSNNADPTAESSNKVIEFTGTLTGNIYVFIPAVENNYIFFNNTSGAFTVTVAPTGHSANGVAITQGAHTIMYNNANNEIKDLFSGSLGDLTLVSGGTFTGNAAGASALNASNVSSGTLDDARLTANVNLNNASTISAGTLADARLTANVNLNNASTISAGTLSNDRLDTVPTTKGGTGLTSLGSAGQVLTVTSPGTALEYTTIAGGGGQEGTVFTSPGTWTKDAGLKAIKVSVHGGGGGGGNSNQNSQPGGGGGGGGFAVEYIQAPSIPGPVPVSVGGGGGAASSGGTSSFGTYVSATGGGGGSNNPGPGAGGAGGSGSGGNYSIDGQSGAPTDPFAGSSFMGHGGDISPFGEVAASGKGGGGAGGLRSPNPTFTGGRSGTGGIVIIEEFY